MPGSSSNPLPSPIAEPDSKPVLPPSVSPTSALGSHLASVPQNQSWKGKLNRDGPTLVLAVQVVLLLLLGLGLARIHILPGQGAIELALGTIALAFTIQSRRVHLKALAQAALLRQQSKSAIDQRVLEQTRALRIRAEELTAEVVARAMAEQESLTVARQLQVRERAINEAAIVAISDATGRIIHANDNYLRLTGQARSEVIARPDPILGEGAPEAYATARAATSQGEIWRGEVQLAAAKGRPHTLATTIVPILSETDKPESFLALSIDITTQKDLQVQLVQAQKLESIGQLAAGIAHEINTPAQYVSDNTRFLRDQFQGLLRVLDEHSRALDPAAGQLSWPERRDAMAKTLHEVDYDFVRREVPLAIEQSLEGLGRITTIISAMKDFSHPGSEHKESTNLNRAIESTITVCRNRWKYTADLELAFDPSLPLVPCLLAELNQVILNLVVNAADAIEERYKGQNKKGKIRVSTRHTDPDWVEVRVEDDGPGIPDSLRERIFDPFFTTKEVGRGTGQGLTICRNVIVHKHAGSLDFVSQPGIGTTFVVRLPLREEAQPRLERAA